MPGSEVRPFGSYAKYYDLIYQDKDYDQECDFLEEVFRRYSLSPVRSILDVGCGTGQHAIRLARKGYRVSGVDASDLAVEMATSKACESKLEADFRVMDMRRLALPGAFDACVAMFAVMNYLTQDDDIERTLSGIRRHLRGGSLFVFDCWNGLAVLRTLPSVTVKRVESGTTRILRVAQPELDALQHLCKVHYEMVVTEDDRVTDRINETHCIRFFFPLEIAHYLRAAGFEVLRICPFLELDGVANENAWNISIITRLEGGRS